MNQKIKVLMVDDEEQFRATTSKILSRKGFHTTMAGSGQEAVDIMKKDPQDIVVLDIKMPGMDGHEALTKLKDISPSVQVIMLTGHGGLDSAKSSLDKGAFDYLTKPCDVDLLAAKINSAYEAIYKKDVRKEKKAFEIMIPIEHYTTITMDITVREAIREIRRSFECLARSNKLMETGHRSVLVFDDQGNAVGILSIVDLLEAIRPDYLSAPKPSMADSMQYSAMFWTGLFTRRALAVAERKVREVMSDSPPEINADANLMEVAELMYTHKARRLLVIRDQKAIGIIREQDLFFEIATIIG